MLSGINKTLNWINPRNQRQKVFFMSFFKEESEIESFSLS